MVKRGAQLACALPRFIRTMSRGERGQQMWFADGRRMANAEYARYAVRAARLSRVIGDPADAAWWLTRAASARLMARAERLAVARLARAA